MSGWEESPIPNTEGYSGCLHAFLIGGAFESMRLGHERLRRTPRNLLITFRLVYLCDVRYSFIETHTRDALDRAIDGEERREQWRQADSTRKVHEGPLCILYRTASYATHCIARSCVSGKHAIKSVIHKIREWRHVSPLYRVGGRGDERV